MERLNWDNFNIKNRDNTKAFEDMCRVLFLRELKKGAYDYGYNVNEAGLEIQPILNDEDGKWYGAQCKYFSCGESSNKYSQIYKSLSKAIKYFKSKLNIIYIYTNVELKPFMTADDMEKHPNSDRAKIIKESKKNNIEIKWLQADNILDLIRKPENRDLYQLYFSDSKELEFLQDVLTIEEETFLQSNELIDLKFINGESINSLYESVIDNKFGLILGEAGTGKSIAIKKIFSELLIDFNKNYENYSQESEICIPIFIRLRECISGDIEDLIRKRLKDYNLNIISKSFKYFYLLDGLDEGAYYDIRKICDFINDIHKKDQVKGILVSARVDSNNLSYFRQWFKWKEYIFKKLSYEDIEVFFKSKNDLKKLKILKQLEDKDILKDLDDIFSLTLLWENIYVVNQNTSKIEIIELAIEYWIKNYSKLYELSLLDPKQSQIMLLCREIAYEMQKRLSLTLALDDIQEIITKTFKLQSPHEINLIVECLNNLFFESSTFSTAKINMSFKHRRFQEYFLYEKIELEYYSNPGILRELKLFHNKEFILNIFLKTSLERARINKNIFKCLTLSLLEYYLGRYYLKNYNDNNIITKKNNYLLIDAPYSYMDNFLHLLSTYNVEELKNLFSNQNLMISDAITEDNYGKFIEIYHRKNNVDISKLIKKECNLETIKVNYRNKENFPYYLYKIKKVSIDELYINIIGKYTFKENDVRNMDYVLTDRTEVHALIKLMLEFELENLTDKISKMDKNILEVLCLNLLEFKYVNIILGNEFKNINFKKAIILRIELKDENYYINTMAVYKLLTNKNTYDTNLKKAFNKANVRNFHSWSTNIGLHVALAYLQNEDDKYELTEFKLGVELLRVVYDNYKDKQNILDKWIDIIKLFNYIYNDWLKYTHSNMLGALISVIDFDSIQLKSFLRELLKYDSVIYSQSVLFNIYKNNNEQFKRIANVGFLDKLLENLYGSTDEQYDDLSESLFQLATMYDTVDKKRKYDLLINGIENCMVRPNYRNEELASDVLPEALYLAYQNYWLEEQGLNSNIERLFSLLERINKNTDNAGNFNKLKWIIENCTSIQKYKNGLYDICSYPLYKKEEIVEYDMNLINRDNLKEYCLCQVKGVPYNSVEFWRKLILDNDDRDYRIEKIYEFLKESKYPHYFGCNQVNYSHIPLYILLENGETRDKTKEFIIEEVGLLSIYQIIKIYGITGEKYGSMEYIDYLFKFCEMLTHKIDIEYRENRKIDITAECLSDFEICRYAQEKWIVDEYGNNAHLKSNPKIKIHWSEEGEPYYSEWANSNPDESAYKYNYKLYFDSKLIKAFDLVWVDGYRALLPIPKGNSNLVRRDEYLLSRIFNINVNELNSYMRRSGLQVE